MIRRGLLIAALTVYLGVFGCSVWTQKAVSIAQENTDATAPTAGRSTTALTGLPYRSVTVQIQRTDWIGKYKKCFDEIAELGADTVMLVVDARQENGSSSLIYLDMRMTPSREALGELIRHAKSRKLRVILMPIVLLDEPIGNQWRGNIDPRDWGVWFKSYRAMIGHFAEIAEGNGVDVLVVGSELVSSEAKPEEWNQTIRHVRGIYKGQLTYSSNWDHYNSVPFWDQLDLIGMNSYWRLDKDEQGKEMREKVTVEQIVANWRKIQADLFKFLHKQNKPLLFLEIGWCSLANAASEPWDYTQTMLPADPDLQRRLYEAFFLAWQGKPELGGFSVWNWPPSDQSSEERDYTPRGKPAEKVLREWLAKPRWQVGGW